ncbi:MAG: NAD(P)/FAD-dependent oxidoreductase [Candidatus Neomarinimicrobiota bacterium]
MKDRYDVLVIGGGPAGTTAARFAALNGVSVALIERDREIGVPVRCAEGVSDTGLKKIIDINPNWIAATVRKFRFYSPTKQQVELHSKETGYVLHRRVFDHALAVEAVKSGAEIFTKATAYGLTRTENSFSNVLVRYENRERTVQAKIVIAADGVESRIARMAGIRTNLPLKDIESCAQVLAGNVDIDPERIDFYLSQKWSPGGYVWVFPKGDRMANIGLGVNGSMTNGRSAAAHLNEFLDENFPNASRLTTIYGGVPVATNLAELVADGLMVVGDAAHQVNPLTGGGISSAMASGKMAGTVAADAIRCGDTSKKKLRAYESEWNRTIGKDYRRFYRLKEWIRNMTDAEFEEIAAAFQGMAPTDVKMSGIFRMAVKNKPSLIVDAIKAFAGF